MIPMSFLFLLTLFLLSPLSLCAQEVLDNTKFIYPPPEITTGVAQDPKDDPTIRIGSNITIEWSTNYKSISLDLVPGAPERPIQYLFSNRPATFSSYSWTVDISYFNNNASTRFYMRLFNASSPTGRHANTHMFRVIDPSVPSADTIPVATSPMPTSSKSAKDGLKPKPVVVAGIVIGSLVGVALTTGIGFFAGYQQRKKRRRLDKDVDTETSSSDGWHTPQKFYGELAGEAPVELSGDDKRVEKDSYSIKMVEPRGHPAMI